jgi:hypothetical protein
MTWRFEMNVKLIEGLSHQIAPILVQRDEYLVVILHIPSNNSPLIVNVFLKLDGSGFGAASKYLTFDSGPRNCPRPIHINTGDLLFAGLWSALLMAHFPVSTWRQPAILYTRIHSTLAILAIDQYPGGAFCSCFGSRDVY